MRRIGLDIIRTRFGFDQRQRLVTQIDDDVWLVGDLEEMVRDRLEQLAELLSAVVELLHEADAGLADGDHGVSGGVNEEAVPHQTAHQLTELSE